MEVCPVGVGWVLGGMETIHCTVGLDNTGTVVMQVTVDCILHTCTVVLYLVPDTEADTTGKEHVTVPQQEDETK